MEKDSLFKQVNTILCKEFQSIWLIKSGDLSLELIIDNKSKAAPNSVDQAKKIVHYDEARSWYIEHYVVEQSRQRMYEQTAIECILSELYGEETYHIEYGRVSGETVNFNQICFDKILNQDGDIEYILMGFRDVDVARKSEIDDLTGLLSRTVFFSRAEEMLHEFPDEQFDVLISDIVDFKKINETYGVSVADAILKWNGEFLITHRPKHTIIGRYGSDQMVLFGAHDSIGKFLSKEVKDAFQAAQMVNGLPFVTWKFGVYENVGHDSSIVSICDKAHMAVNSIKHHYVQDIAFYGENIENALEKQRRIEKSMHKSLKRGDFKVYYQPKHEAKTGKLVGAEALIRWIHPEYGFMSPADFIPIFEQNGFIIENDRYVWNRTCENIRRWMDSGIQTVPISVNASKLTMTNADIVDNMKGAVAKYNLNTEQLHIEITETLMTENTADLIKKLNEIRSAGFKVELDDFGSGYSSINILSTLPLDIVKLDMSFMQQFGDKKRALILESCIDLAKKLGFKTVSEGVELIEQSEELGRLGVDMIQGYFYSKPLPEDEFEKYMIENLK